MPRILIVDDEPRNLKALKLGLQDMNPNWDIVTAQEENSALELLRAHPFDVVLTDLVMASEQGGMKILQAAREADPWTMVILFTAYEKKLERYKAFELGAFDCVQKNTYGVNASEELNVKAREALHFRELALAQIEHQRRLAFMQRYFDRRVFDTIEQNPSLLDVQSRTVTICFWDVRGFSRLCEILKAHPKLIAGFLRDYCQAASEVIFEHGGVLDKFIGDGVMALFGALQPAEDGGRRDAENAVNAALALRDRFDSVLAKWMAEWSLYTAQAIEIGLGCGIHTGVDTLVGNVGTELRDQFTALGPDVNLASRLESKSLKGQIVVSATTEARVQGHFAVEKLEPFRDIKNIQGDFQAFSVTGLAAVAHITK